MHLVKSNNQALKYNNSTLALRCSNVLATGCTTSARKSHLRMTPEDEVRRGVEPRLRVLMERLLVLWNFNTASDTHCTVLVAQKHAKPITAKKQIYRLRNTGSTDDILRA